MALYVQVPRLPWEVFRVEMLRLRGLEGFFTAEYQIMLGVRTKRASLQTVSQGHGSKERKCLYVLAEPVVSSENTEAL